MIKPFLLLTALMLPSLANATTLELPADAQIKVQVIDRLTLDADTPRRNDILLRPSAEEGGTHRLPAYCVVIGDALQERDRLRITAKALTCIKAEGGESEIYSGAISAGAYDTDGAFGLAACADDRCELSPDDAFELRLASPLAIEQLENPAAQLNEQRRQAEGAGVANPIPAERPDPDQ